MRITNKIMQNNSLTNLNNNKILQDNLNTQIATEKKINRPSDDPVIAIRALRLRTNLSEVTQYVDKNVADAEGWISGTEDALTAMSEVLKSMYSQCQSGAEESLTSEERTAILEQLKGLRDEVYDTGDADYGGRTLFTGYRTGEKLRFQENTENDNYRITEDFTSASLSTITYVNSGTLADVNSGNYNAIDATKETAVSTGPISRIRLSYDNLDGTGVGSGNSPELTFRNQLNGCKLKLGDVENINIGGTPAEIIKLSFISVSTADSPNPYDKMNEINKDEKDETAGSRTAAAIYVPETGEILLSNRFTTAIQNDKTTNMSAAYEKSSWEKGDLRPEHYFVCTEKFQGETKVYNQDKDGNPTGAQYMEYDIGYNQTMRVNTLASEAFTHDIGRTVDELVQASQDVVDMEKSITALEAMQGDNAYDQEKVEERLAAANKALTYLKDKEQKLYAAGMTSMQEFMAKNNLATTNLGNRSARLDLVKTRLTSQKTNFKGLVNENEGADTAEVATELKSAATAYDAALMATGKIVQNSLMNYI